MTRRGRPPRPQRPLLVPPGPPLQHRAHIGHHALSAAYGAHKGHEHAGRPGLGCATCGRYLAAVVAARAAERVTAEGEAPPATDPTP